MRLWGVAGETPGGTACPASMDRCVEVVARFGQTVLDVAHVPLDATYRVGTAADVDITVPGLGSFPILEGGRVRRPVGCVARGLAGTEARLAPRGRGRAGIRSGVGGVAP